MADDCPKCEEGLPPWMGTFADLMSLLMCFFVLLLSFATMDAVRFKKMAETMKDAFGVQREIPTNEIIKGISVIKTEFSPSTIPEPSPIDEIRQVTQEEKVELKVEQAEVDKKQIEIKQELQQEKKEDKTQDAMLTQLEEARRRILKEVENDASDLKELIQDEIDQNLITVETKDANIIIRIKEKASFPSGQAELNAGFLEVLDRISAAIASMPGRIVVAGHTDNIPISTARFRSNWELSSSRAVSVVEELLRNGDIAADRMVVEGRGDSVPLVPNDSRENRAENRRVEIIIARGEDILEGVKKLLPGGGQSSEPGRTQP
jgi:chemotaxis protein MotB